MSRLCRLCAAPLAVALAWGFLVSSAVAQPPSDDTEAFITDQLPEPSTPRETLGQDLSRQLQPPVNPFREPRPSRESGQAEVSDQLGRTAAAPASLRGSTQSVPQNFNIRLARAPKMLGDFIGRGGSTATTQAPSFTVMYTDFNGIRTFAGLGDGSGFGTARLSAVPSDLGEFVPGTVFSQTVGSVAFRTVDTLTDINLQPNLPVALEIVGQNGSGTSDANAQAQVQANANSFLPSEATVDKQTQRNVILSQNGSGTFGNNGGSDSVVVGNPTATTVANTIDVTTPFSLNLPYSVVFADETFTPNPVDIVLPTPSAGDIVGRVRLQDNNSPLPQNRIFFDYNFFYNVPFTTEGVNVNRFSPGIEKTFWNGMASFEIRLPMAITLNSNIISDLPSDVSNYEFGNIALSTKFLLTSTENTALAVGLGVSLPTADDLDIGLADGTDLLSIQNQSPHILPYLAFLYAPNYSDFFAQAFLTFDFDTRGSPVYANVNGLGLNEIGTWQDQNLITLSFSAGSWLYENRNPCSRVNRIGWSAELHYTSTLNDADSVSAGSFTVGDPDADLSLLNGTIGGHVRLRKTTFTVGYSVPLTSSDRVFDGELRFFANRAF